MRQYTAGTRAHGGPIDLDEPAHYSPGMTQRLNPFPFDRARLDEVSSRLGLRMLVLFGSRATGSPPPHPDSDVDVAIGFGSGKKSSFWDSHAALSDVFPGESLDLVALDSADPLLRWEIMRDGVLLWGDPDDFLELRAFAYRDFVDSADLRALERTLSEKKLARIRQALGSAS